MIRSAAEILREYGPFPGVDHVHGVTFDGQHVWFASGGKPNASDPGSGKTVRATDVAGQAGTAFDGPHLFQLAGEGRSCLPGDIDRAHRLPARRIEGVQLVSGRKPDVLTVIRDPMHAVDTRKGSILTEDFGCRSFHASILVTRQWSGE